MKDYREALSARNEHWKAEARSLMKSGVEFVIVHLRTEDYRDCRALAREFGYSECLEDDVSPSRPDSQSKPIGSPTRIGFVKRGLLKPNP